MPIQHSGFSVQVQLRKYVDDSKHWNLFLLELMSEGHTAPRLMRPFCQMSFASCYVVWSLDEVV